MNDMLFVLFICMHCLCRFISDSFNYANKVTWKPTHKITTECICTAQLPMVHVGNAMHAYIDRRATLFLIIMLLFTLQF